MKFLKGNNSQFYSSLHKKVDYFFADNRLSKTGGEAAVAKTIVLLASFIFLYVSILVFQPDMLVMLALAICLGIVSTLIFFNIVHDASHKVLFKKKSLNKWLCYMGDVVGVNTYIWHIRHDIQHHSFAKVPGGDLILENIPVVRLSPYQNFKPFHKYQVYYAPVLYALYSLYWILILDFRFFLKKELYGKKKIIHPRKEWAKLIFFKVFYISYMLVVPAIVLPYSFGYIVTGFLIMHLFVGIIVAVVSVLGHEVMGLTFPHVDKDDVIHNSWGEHGIQTTADFSNKSKLLTWLTGGLNNHVCHHLFPTICHIHYYKLTPIVRQHCIEHGYTFNEYSLIDGIKAHMGYLKFLSK